MKTISLRVDVDTLEGSLKGIPALLRMLDKHQMRASFFFCFGPDNSGKAIRRIFRKGFLAKMRRTNGAKLYGFKTMMYGVLLPAPIIWKRAAAQMRAAREAGHEVAIHGWDHVQYHDLLDRKSRAWLEAWYRDAHAAFAEVFGEPARGAVSPAWRCNDTTLEIQESYGLDYAGDCRGTRAFYPVVGGRTLNTLQVPTTLPTLDELLGLDGMTADQVNRKVWDLVREDALNVYALHTEVEGGALADTFDAFLAGLKARGVAARTHADWVPELRQGAPAQAIGRIDVRGGAGGFWGGACAGDRGGGGGWGSARAGRVSAKTVNLDPHPSGSAPRSQPLVNGVPMARTLRLPQHPLRALAAGCLLAAALACGAGSGTNNGPSGSRGDWTGAACLETNLLFNSRNPSVAVDGQGNGFVAWQLDRSGTAEIWGRPYQTGTGWLPEGTLTSLSNNNSVPRVALAGGTDFMFSWQHGDTSTIGGIYVNRYRPGVGLDLPLLLNTGTGQAPAIAANAAGQACMVWTQADAVSGLQVVMASRFLPAQGWTQPEAVSTNPTVQSLWPQVVMDGNGAALVAWYQTADAQNGPFAFMASGYLPAQGWTAPFSPQATSGTVDTSFGLAMGQGGAHAVWAESTDGGRTYQIYASRWSPAGNTLSAARMLSSATGDAYLPVVATDAQGNALAAWVDAQGASGCVYVAGGGWQGSQPVVTSTQGVGNLALAMNASGSATLVYQISNGTVWTIAAQRYVTGSGWTDPTALSVPGGNCYAPAVAVGAGSHVLASWYQLDAQGIRHIWADWWR